MRRTLWIVLLALACNGGISETDTDTDTDTEGPVDADGDGYTRAIDCDDDNADVNPGAEEVCNGIDDNCDQIVDEDAVDRFPVYSDVDRDGFGDPETESLVCQLPPDVAETAGDCDDTDPDVNPEATEVCDPDDVDEDCDGLSDDADDVDAGTFRTFFADADGDGFGDPDRIVRACDPAPGRVLNDEDCDDTDLEANPDDGCPGPWDGLYDGTVVFDISIPEVGARDTCSARGGLSLDSLRSPALTTEGGTPWTCSGTTAGGSVGITGELVDEDTIGGEFDVDGQIFVFTATVDETGLTAEGSETKMVSGFRVTLGHELTATPR